MGSGIQPVEAHFNSRVCHSLTNCVDVTLVTHFVDYVSTNPAHHLNVMEPTPSTASSTQEIYPVTQSEATIPRTTSSSSRPPNRGVGGLTRGSILTPGAGHATRIPPSLQAKMAAVCLIRIKRPQETQHSCVIFSDCSS